MAKKLRLTPEEVTMLKDSCEKLPNMPMIDKDGNAIIIWQQVRGVHVLEQWDSLKANGQNPPPKNTIDIEQYYSVPTIQFIDKVKLMGKALLAGRLQEVIRQYNANYEKYQTQLIQINTPKEELTGEEIEKAKQRESDKHYAKERAEDKRRLGHTRKRYHN